MKIKKVNGHNPRPMSEASERAVLPPKRCDIHQDKVAFYYVGREGFCSECRPRAIEKARMEGSYR